MGSGNVGLEYSVLVLRDALHRSAPRYPYYHCRSSLIRARDNVLVPFRLAADNEGIMFPSPLPSSAVPREPQLLRFRLRQMFFWVTLASVLCALLVLTEGPLPLVISTGALLVAAHVLGNLIGTRLRDTSHEVRLWRANNPRSTADAPVTCGRSAETAKQHLPLGTPLADHGRVSHWLLWIVAAGTLLGAIVGFTTIALTIGPQISWQGWAVGTISCAVLGTWGTFLASSFSSIARHAWREAEEKGK